MEIRSLLALLCLLHMRYIVFHLQKLLTPSSKETPFLGTVGYQGILHVIWAVRLTILSIIEGPCQGFTWWVVPSTYSALVISCLRVKNMVTACLLKIHKNRKLSVLVTHLSKVFHQGTMYMVNIGLSDCDLHYLNTSLKTERRVFLKQPKYNFNTDKHKHAIMIAFDKFVSVCVCVLVYSFLSEKQF